LLLGLRLNRTVLRLFGTVLLWLRLFMPVLRLLGLFGPVLGPLLELFRALLLRLDGLDLRLLRLNGANLVRLVGLVGAIVGVYRLAGTDWGLTRCYVRLIGAGWLWAGLLYLGSAIWFTWAITLLAWAIPLLTRTVLGLARTVWHGAGICAGVCAGSCSWVGAGIAGLRGDRAGGCDDRWAASVDVVELLAVLCCFVLVLNLSGHGRNSGAAHGFDFCRPRSVGDAASTSVVGDAGVVVDDDLALIDITDTGADAVDGAVVIEVVATPIAAVVADAGVAEAIVDAAVKADVRAPESPVEAPAIVIPAPVAGGPEGAVVGWSAPGAGDPVVAGGSPVPIAGGPDVVGRGGFRLLINGQGRRRLVGVFDGGSFAFFVELLGGLGVLIGLVLI
jgi:hypothetical protein